MSRRRLVCAVAAAVLVLQGPITSSAQAAVADCDAIVVDDAGVLDVEGVVQEAVGSATRAGANVRLRAYDAVPGGDLDGYIASIEASCPSWQGADGVRRSNLLVLAVSVSDRATGLYYGSAYEGPLGGQWSRIQADLMNPYFRDGDFDAGLAAGTNEAVRLVEAWQHPAAPAPPAASAAAPLPLAAAPADSNRFGGFPAVAVGLLVLAAAITAAVVGIPAWRRRRATDRMRAAAAGRAQAAYETAANAFLAMDAKVREVTTAVEAVTAATSADDDVPMLAGLRAAKTAVDDASGRWIAADEQWSATRAGTVTRGESDSAERRFTTITKEIAAASALLDEVGAQAEGAAHAIGVLPAELDRVRGLVEAAKVDTEAASAAGFDVTALTARMSSAGQSLNQVSAMIAERQVGAASALLARVEEDAAGTSSIATTLPHTIADCADGLAAADRDRVALDAAYPAASATLGALIDHYGAACLTGVDARVSGIPAALGTAASAVVDGNAALALRSPEGLARGQAALATAAGALAEVRDATTQLTERGATLAELEASLPGRLAALETQIAGARAYASSHDRDVDRSRSADLEAAATGAQAIAVSLREGRPNLPTLAARLSDVEGSTAAASSAARSDVHAAEEGRSKAKAALARAKADLASSESALAQYDRGGRGRADLTAARRVYEKALATDDVALIVSLSAQASRQAGDVQRSALETFEQAENATRAAEADRADASDRSSGGGGSTGFGSGEGGGGSSKW